MCLWPRKHRAGFWPASIDIPIRSFTAWYTHLTAICIVVNSVYIPRSLGRGAHFPTRRPCRVSPDLHGLIRGLLRALGAGDIGGGEPRDRRPGMLPLGAAAARTGTEQLILPRARELRAERPGVVFQCRIDQPHDVFAPQFVN